MQHAARQTHTARCCAAASLACLLTCGTAAAESVDAADVSGVDTTRWLCRLCPYPDGWYGALIVGPGWVSDSSNRFGDYRGLDDQGIFGTLGGSLHYRSDDGRYLDLYAANLGLDSRRLDLRGGAAGRYEFRLAWQEIPRYRGDGTRTPFRTAGDGTLNLPAGWRPAAATADMADLADALAETGLGLKREILRAGLTLKFSNRWSYDIDYHHEEKKGTRPFGGGVFMIHATHFPAPVDFTTDRFGMGLALQGDRAHLRAGFVGSEFRNARSSVTWQNPFTAVAGTGTLRAALEPDNRYYQFNLSGAYTPSRRLRFSGRAAWGRMKQNDPFLPGYSINPEFSDLPLPRLSYAGEVDSRSLYLAGRMTARLADRLDLVADLKLDERDNKSPVDLWAPVITDLVLREPRPNRPYRFERDRYRLELGYRPLAPLRLSGAWQRENIRRSLQSVAETREDTIWGEVRIDPLTRMQVRLRLEHADRDATPYAQLVDGGPIEHPLQRKFHLADRQRNRATVEVDLVPLERVGIGLAWHSSEDEYRRSVIGLQDSTDRILGVDFSFALSDESSVHAFATREEIESTIASAVSAEAAPWQGRTDDRFLTLGFGADHRFNDRLSIGVEFVIAHSDGRIAVDSGAGEPPFPDLETRLRNVRVRAEYRFNAQWSGKLIAEYERYDSEDWALDGLGPDGIPAVLTLGNDSPEYEVVVLRILASCRF